MNRMIGLVLILTLGVLILSCQAPKQIVDKMDQQLKATEELGKRVDALEAKLAQATEAFNQLGARFDEHMEKYHKTKVTTEPVPKVRPPAKK